MVITQDVLNKLAYVSKFDYNGIENFLGAAANKGQLIQFNNIWLNTEYFAVYNPLRDKTNDELLGYFTPEDNWNEYSREERLEKIKQSKQLLPSNWVDWNDYSLEQLVDYLRNKYRFSSSGEAHAVNKLIKFYEQKKDA